MSIKDMKVQVQEDLVLKRKKLEDLSLKPLPKTSLNDAYFPKKFITKPNKKVIPRTPIKSIQTHGPYLAHSISSSESNQMLKLAPLAITKMARVDQASNQHAYPSLFSLSGNSTAGSSSVDANIKLEMEERAELVRRLTSMENASAGNMKKFNKERIRSMFGEHSMDSGSSVVQVALFTLRINSIKEHLKVHRKDVSTKRQLINWESKRSKMMKYLRKRNLEQYVLLCKSMGVELETANKQQFKI